MKLYSFKLIVTITVFLAVGTLSFFAIYLYDNFLAKEMYKHAEEDVLSGLSMIQANFIHSVSQYGGNAVHPLLEDLKKNSRLRHIYLFNSKDSLVYRSDYDSLKTSILGSKKITDFKQDITIESSASQPDPNLRAYIRLVNSPNCYKCHDPSEKYLGMLVFDIPMVKTRNNIALTRDFGILYAALIVFIILISVFLVHYRFVKKSLHKFHKSIDLINHGDLDERISIPGSRELGELGKSFNEMVDTFQKTQQELLQYHQQKLETRYKMATIGEMTARLAHEIRNPITGIANATEILVNQGSEDKNKPILEEIRRQAERVNNAISNMLRFSRPTHITLEKSDINEVMKNLVFFIKNQTHHKKIEFGQELQDNIPRFRFDHEKIENVLLNLGLNAIQAIPKAGTITFKTAFDPENKTVLITVEDTGMGMPENVLKNVFSPFFTTRTEGTGLGLAIVREIVEKHNGKIWVESEESKGSRFFIILPAG